MAIKVQHKDLTGADLHATKDDSVGAVQLKSDAVITTKILNDNVTDAKLASKNLVKAGAAGATITLDNDLGLITLIN